MGESVHAGCGGQSFGHGGHHFGVDNSHNGNVMGVDADEFALFLHVGNNIVDGDLCGGSRGCGNGDNGNAGVLCGSNSLERTDVGKFGIGNDDTDCL